MNVKLIKYKNILTSISLSIITFLIYLPTLKFPFIYDDMPTITENIHVIKGNFLNTNIIFSFNRWLSRIYHSFIYKIWGANPTPFRVINILLHISIGLMIFVVLKKLFSNLNKNSFLNKNSYLISLFTSALFLLHPAQTQTVTYITQMSLEGMVTFFIFGVITTFVFAVFSKNKFLKYMLYSTSIALTALSAGTKEIIITLPFLVFIIDLFFIAQGKWSSIKKRLPFHITLFVVLFGALAIQGFKPINFANKTISRPISNNRGNILTSSKQIKISSGIYSISQFKVFLHYLRIYFWPFPLAFEYGYKLSESFWSLNVIFPMLAILLILFLALMGFIKNKSNALSFGLFWFFIGTLPRTSFIPSTELICDYKTYISSFGIILFISIILVYLLQYSIEIFKVKKFQFQIISLVAFFLISGAITKNQNQIWKDELSYWGHAVKVSPHKARLYNNYGVALSNNKRIQESIESYKKACECDPAYAEPVINLAFHYQAQGKKDLAMNEYKKAINMNEFHPEMYLNLGSLHLTNKAYDKALMCFNIALKYKSYYSRAHFNKGFTYEQMGQLDNALKCYEDALKGNYQNIQFYYQHGKVAHQLNELDKALNSLEKVKQENINFQDTIFRLASIYYQKRDYKNAAINFEIEYKKHPNNKVLAYNLAQSYLNLREHKKALPLFENCQADTKTFPYAKLHIGKCLNDLGQKEQAILALQNLIKNPPHQGVLNDGINLLKSITT
jgi:protein O-mannosyl-transferase